VVAMPCLPPVASGWPALPLLLVLPSRDNDDTASALNRRAGGFVTALAAGDSLSAANWALVGRDREGVSIIHYHPAT